MERQIFVTINFTKDVLSVSICAGLDGNSAFTVPIKSYVELAQKIL